MLGFLGISRISFDNSIQLQKLYFVPRVQLKACEVVVRGQHVKHTVRNFSVSCEPLISMASRY